MAVVTTTYSASTTITCSVASLVSSTTFVAGQESAVVSNVSDKYVDALLSGRITVGTTPTTNTNILVYVFSALDDVPNYPDVMDGTDSAETITSAGVGTGYLKLAATLTVDSATSNRVYEFSQVAIAPLFGGVLPARWSVFVTHNTGVALNSTAGNHFFKYTGIKYDIT